MFGIFIIWSVIGLIIYVNNLKFMNGIPFEKYVKICILCGGIAWVIGIIVYIRNNEESKEEKQK